jgi:RNA polymerase sigma-70 factor (ECF subfamily)
VLDDERQRLLDAVRRLPAHERVAVSLRYFEGRGVNEIAQITGRPVGTVTKQLTRAIDRLRSDLAPAAARG